MTTEGETSSQPASSCCFASLRPATSIVWLAKKMTTQGPTAEMTLKLHFDNIS